MANKNQRVKKVRKLHARADKLGVEPAYVAASDYYKSKKTGKKTHIEVRELQMKAKKKAVKESLRKAAKKQLREAKSEKDRSMNKTDHALYNKAYSTIAAKKKWQNRDFNDQFDYEVRTLWAKMYDRNSNPTEAALKWLNESTKSSSFKWINKALEDRAAKKKRKAPAWVNKELEKAAAKKAVKESRSFLKEIITELHNCVRHEQEEVPLVWSKDVQDRLTDTDHWNRAQRAKSHVGNMDFQDKKDQDIVVPYNDNYGHPVSSPDSSDYAGSGEQDADIELDFGAVGDNENIGGLGGFSEPWGDYGDDDSDEIEFGGEGDEDNFGDDMESFADDDVYSDTENSAAWGDDEDDEDDEEEEVDDYPDRPSGDRDMYPMDDEEFGDEDRMIDVGDDEDFEDSGESHKLTNFYPLNDEQEETAGKPGNIRARWAHIDSERKKKGLTTPEDWFPSRAKKKFKNRETDFRGKQKIDKPRRDFEEEQEEMPQDGMNAQSQTGGGNDHMSQWRQNNPDESNPTNQAVDNQYGEDDPNTKGDDFADATGTGEQQEWDDPDYQGVIRTVPSAHLVFKRQQEDGTFNELWLYNLGHDFKRELKIRRGILAGTDIPVNKMRSPDSKQRYELWTVGNGQLLQISGLPN